MDDGGGTRVPDERRRENGAGRVRTRSLCRGQEGWPRRRRRWRGEGGCVEGAGGVTGAPPIRPAPRTSRAHRSPPSPPYVYYSFCQKLVYEVRINQPELLRRIRTLRYVCISCVYLDLPTPKRPGGIPVFTYYISNELAPVVFLVLSSRPRNAAL